MFTRVSVFSNTVTGRSRNSQNNSFTTEKHYSFAKMSDLTTAAIKKLKVAELKAELSKRGLSTKGRKDELTCRLVDAVEGLDRTLAEEEVEDAKKSEESESQAEEDQSSQNVNGAEDAKPVEVPLPDGDAEMAEPEKDDKEDGAQPQPEETADSEIKEADQGELEKITIAGITLQRLWCHHDLILHNSLD